MFDPLSSTASIFAAGTDEEPPWPTTPHTPKSPVPNLRRASSPPATPDKGPTPGLYGREPQIYGQPEAGLISPQETVGSNGTKFEKPEPYLRVRITGLDRNRRDILVKLDAQTNLQNFGGNSYRNVSRSYVEFQQFYESLVHSNPQTIVPALPLAQTSAPTDEEDDRLVRIMLQRWMTRVCEDVILLHDEDLRSFIESDFGYQPTPRPRRRASSGFGIMRRNVPDEDEELQRARFELTKLEGQFFDTAKAVDKLANARKSIAFAHAEMGNKLINVATTEAHPPLGNAFRKIGRVWHSLADLDQAQAVSECVILGDSLGYQGMNARSAKETLQMRTGVLEEYQAAVKTTISKRRNIERLKASSTIRPERVDEALEDMDEANKYEQTLAKRAEGISQNLHQALQTHNRYANDDITTALIEHARSSIMYERQLLKELEALRTDVANAANKVVPSAVNVPKPSIIPPLEDFSKPISRVPSTAPIENGFHRQQTPEPQRPPMITTQSYSNQDSDPLLQAPTPRPAAGGPAIGSHPQRQTPPMSAPPSQTFASARQGSLSASASGSPGPSTPRSPLPPQSPGAGPSTPNSERNNFASSEPPLGGRFADGSRSMFVKTSSPLASPLATSSSSTFASSGSMGDPLLGGAATMSRATSSPLASSQSFGSNNNGFDPLGQSRPNYMSSSVRVQPTRSRLDAREAASKLANMF
ncbi:Vps5 C terminal like-domain-containing protein [Mycena floridula]|nr:Vps5 C terminal like-domain-containing protein [Mycena floridula]